MTHKISAHAAVGFAALVILSTCMGCASSRTTPVPAVDASITPRRAVSAARLSQSLEAPDYPLAARRAAVEGRVWVTFQVDGRGAVSQAQVTDGLGYGCDEVVLDWIRTVHFQPATDEQGRPRVAWFTMPVRFELE